MSKRVSLRKKRKIKDINDSRIEIDIEDKIISNYSIQLPIMLDRVKNIPLPKKEEQLRIVTVKTLSSVHFIEKITSHAKVILVKTTENYYILEGSMNLSVNARIEQLTFENSEKIYNFHKEWINEVFNQINQK